MTPISTGDADIVKVLIDNGADVNYRSWGATPLHQAVKVTNLQHSSNLIISQLFQQSNNFFLKR